MHWVKYRVFRNGFLNTFYDTPLMKYLDEPYVWFSCCATFLVDTKLFKTRPKSFYREMIHSFRSYHIEDPEFSSYRCGKLLEYMWHIIFTDNPIMEDRNFTIVNDCNIFMHIFVLLSFIIEVLNHQYSASKLFSKFFY